MAKQTFLALVLVGAGSCWYYGSTKEAAVEGVKRQLKADWSRLFDFKKGTPLKVNLFDVTELPDKTPVRFSESGVYADLPDGTTKLEMLELVETTF